MLAHKVLKEGPGDPLIFFHGFLGGKEDWEPVCSYLPPCKCIAFDLPGHGESRQIKDLSIPFERFHLIGYSMGGRIALQFFQKKALSLILLSTHPGLQTEEEKEKRYLHDQKWAQKLLEMPIDAFLKHWYDQAIFKSFTPPLGKRMQQDPSSLSWALLEYSLAKQNRFSIDEVLVGEKDEKFKTLFSNPIIIRDAAHMIHLENPKQVASHIKQRIFS